MKEKKEDMITPSRSLRLNRSEATYDRVPPATEKLLDEEERMKSERRDKITRITHELEDIFLREDMTMGDISEVMNLFNYRASEVFSKAKIKYVKEQYDRQ